MNFLRTRRSPAKLEPRSLYALDIKGDPLFRDLVGSGLWRSGGLEVLGGNTVRYLSSRSRASAIAVSIFHGDEEIWAYRAVEDARLKRAIFRSPSSGAENGENELFRSLGFGGTVDERSKASGRVRVWLGFKPGNAVTTLDAQIAAEVVRLVEEELLYREKLDQVSGAETFPGLNRHNLLAQFSHDIRSPLNNIKAILALLKLEELRPESAELLDVALSNCRGVEAIVEDVMDLSRFRAGKLDRRREQFDARELVAEVIEGFAVSAKLKGLRLRVDSKEDASVIDADRNQIRRVITNLVCNALKYTKFGEVVVKISGVSNGSVSIAVRDTGVGMSRSELASLFVPFTRHGQTEAPGLGLGLSIAKMLVERNAGTLNVRSVPGEGSEFTLLLPGLPATKRPEYLESESKEVSTASRSSPRILVVDDDKDYVRSISRLLRNDGFVVQEALTVHDGLSILNFGGADIILTDSEMPHGGGRCILEAALRLKTPIPVIFVTGDAFLHREAKVRGCSAVLNKPCEYTMLKSTVLEILSPRPRAADG